MPPPPAPSARCPPAGGASGPAGCAWSRPGSVPGFPKPRSAGRGATRDRGSVGSRSAASPRPPRTLPRQPGENRAGAGRRLLKHFPPRAATSGLRPGRFPPPPGRGRAEGWPGPPPTPGAAHPEPAPLGPRGPLPAESGRHPRSAPPPRPLPDRTALPASSPRSPATTGSWKGGRGGPALGFGRLFPLSSSDPWGRCGPGVGGWEGGLGRARREAAGHTPNPGSESRGVGTVCL